VRDARTEAQDVGGGEQDEQADQAQLEDEELPVRRVFNVN